MMLEPVDISTINSIDYFCHFKVSVPSPAPLETLTKRGPVSDVAKTFDVMGWFSPSTTNQLL